MRRVRVRRSHKLLSTAGINDFSLNDIIKPEGVRLRRNLSAIINFAKFHEDRQPVYAAMTEKTDVLRTAKLDLEAENERLVTEVRDANQQRAQEKPTVDALLAENQQHTTVVSDLFNQQTEIKAESQKIKGTLATVTDKIKETEYDLQEASAQRDDLKAQIVPDPRKLRIELRELQAAEVTERGAVRELEVKLAQYAKQREVLERVEREVDEALALQVECEGELTKVKEAQRSLKAGAERAARDEGKKAEQEHEMRTFNQRSAHLKERLERIAEQHAVKQQVADDAHADALHRWQAVQNLKSSNTRQLEENESTARELRDKLLRGRIEHETETASVQQQQHLLAMQVPAHAPAWTRAWAHTACTARADALAVLSVRRGSRSQVRAYHQDLLSAMKAASASQQQLVAA